MVRTIKSLKRYGLLAALALALLQVIVVSHALTADHPSEERCQVCLVAERTDDALPPAGLDTTQPAGALDVTGSVIGHDRPTLTRQCARGPPSL